MRIHKKLLRSCSSCHAGLPQSMTKHALRIKLTSESVSWCVHHLQNGDGRVQMGSGLLKVVGTSAHIGGQVLTLKGQTCSLGMAFTMYLSRVPRIDSVGTSMLLLSIVERLFEHNKEQSMQVKWGKED